MGIKCRHFNQYMSLLEKHVSTSITDVNGVIVCVSEAFCEMTGYTQEELIGKKHNLLRHPDIADEIYRNLWATITEGKTWHGRIKNLKKNKDSYWVDAYIEPIFDEGAIIGYQAVRQNITDEALFETMAKIDPLTRLYNRNSIEEFAQLFIDEAQRYQTSFSVIMVDLDDFKHINDVYGHPVGDEVLKKLSVIFQDLIRSSDRIGRWGGEEFIILCPQTTYLQAKELAERLRFGFSSHEFEEIGYKTASFGVALFEDEDTIESLIVKADNALYDSKRLGKNRVS
ncbi:diguanylate cyclase with PAS/PAC sensor [Sulfuricurvum kujiense DSM 16994]|uniref:diguanylate cyclase n=1 Tax=Sulfuricurvum kujiense (strain ATCC BAA-921 / DSM 16994 / JCM 11577 / YK-1) TaxID=709032 RepID=E4U2F1_SULKY|nr:GGDEF domain-containing protein [Sulfuricurvum kujiense]ADR34638.1 diguanylate cyclase with PAS/PAC sensor [Sulfuricurvum kujiense DSM 16994]